MSGNRLLIFGVIYSVLAIVLFVGCALNKSPREAGRQAEKTAPASQGKKDDKITSLQTLSQFKGMVLESENPVLVKFYTPTCHGCRMLVPILNELASTYAGRVNFVKVNTQVASDIVEKYDIFGTPILLIFKGTKEAKRLINPKMKAEIQEAIESVL